MRTRATASFIAQVAIRTDASPLLEDSSRYHTQLNPRAMEGPCLFEGQHDGLPVVQGDDLQDGMLPRDVPQRTTFYDPVAERQMTQTDAKLFYQRSKMDGRGVGSPSWTQSPPQGSPLLLSSSRPATEYGADSLVLDPDGGKQALLLELGAWDITSTVLTLVV